ncbi:MAG: hypothetical protein J5565_00460 [Muribaculaceae bacterium]|nr:hypothetical protein [Muribaculaceae bacterium]
MRQFVYSCVLLCCLTSCAGYQLPPFGTTDEWKLNGNVVDNGHMQVNFGGESTSPLANASNGEYDLNFITSKALFNAYDPSCAKLMTDVVKRIPLKIDSIDVMLADQFLILSTSVTSKWKPDYIRRGDGAFYVTQANPIETLVQPHDEIWRNLIFNKKEHQIIVVDRLVQRGKHYAIVYVMQSERKNTAICYQYDITDPQNVQAVGTQLESLLSISIKALEKSCTHQDF